MSGELGPLRAAVERLMEAQRETLELTNRALDAEGEGLDGEERSGASAWRASWRTSGTSSRAP